MVKSLLFENFGGFIRIRQNKIKKNQFHLITEFIYILNFNFTTKLSKYEKFMGGLLFIGGFVSFCINYFFEKKLLITVPVNRWKQSFYFKILVTNL